MKNSKVTTQNRQQNVIIKFQIPLSYNKRRRLTIQKRHQNVTIKFKIPPSVATCLGFASYSIYFLSFENIFLGFVENYPNCKNHIRIASLHFFCLTYFKCIMGSKKVIRFKCPLNFGEFLICNQSLFLRNKAIRKDRQFQCSKKDETYLFAIFSNFY